MSRGLPEVPHQFPFRLVERAGADDRSAVVLRSGGDALDTAGPWPVTLVAEAMAQAILVAHPEASDAPKVLVGLNRVRLLQAVRAGDRIEVHATLEGAFGGTRQFACRALRGGALVAVADVIVKG